MSNRPTRRMTLKDRGEAVKNGMPPCRVPPGPGATAGSLLHGELTGPAERLAAEAGLVYTQHT